MKIGKSTVISIVEALLNAALIPLFFVKLFSVGDAQYSIREFNLGWYLLKYDPLFLIPIAIALCAYSAFIALLSLFIKNKNLRHASHIFTACSLVLFLLLLFISTIVYDAIQA